VTIWDFAHEHWFVFVWLAFVAIVVVFLFGFLVLAFLEAWHSRNVAARIAIATKRKVAGDE
jgi:hypothetical protein